MLERISHLSEAIQIRSIYKESIKTVPLYVFVFTYPISRESNSVGVCDMDEALNFYWLEEKKYDLC